MSVLLLSQAKAKTTCIPTCSQPDDDPHPLLLQPVAVLPLPFLNTTHTSAHYDGAKRGQHQTGRLEPQIPKPVQTADPA
ncbi:hypothetical protein CMEL01_08810 [Colletotrichum melonis]|uniref:Uncharacterized protein n=1 Tax=Colletotrichum melonis TaxID=1209925 RepID=A0AAI9U0N8_9PEZI|nr:hypothetical protein CMEL01_08810 [Colletotrichum melonis]